MEIVVTRCLNVTWAVGRRRQAWFPASKIATDVVLHFEDDRHRADTQRQRAEALASTLIHYYPFPVSLAE